MRDRALLCLLQISDSAFPTGAFSHSMGLEAFAKAGELKDAEDLERVVKLYLLTLATSDCVALRASHGAGMDAHHANSLLYDEREKTALEYADAMTMSDRDVDDELFARVRGFFGDDALVELTAAIAWENSSSKFNRALRVPSQGLWDRRKEQ